MRCHRNLTVTCINQPMIKVVLLYFASLKVIEPTDAIKWGLTVSANKIFLLIESLCVKETYPVLPWILLGDISYI